MTILLLLKDKSWVLFYLSAFLIRLSIGTLHYLYFLDPSYFSSDGMNLPLPHDFTISLTAVNEIVSSKYEYGLFHYEDHYIAHVELWNFISYSFYFFGGYILNIVPLNSFMSVFSSINIVLISKYILEYTTIKLRKIAIISAFFPLTLISSFFFRDVTGIALMSIALVMLTFTKMKISQYFIFLVPALYLFYMQRTIYPVVLLIAFVLDYLVNSKQYISKFNLVLSFLLFIPLLIILSRWSYDLGLSEGSNSVYIDGASTVNYYFLPLKLLMGIIGPYPWTQYFTTGRIEYSYQFADYLQGVLNITVVILIFGNLKRFVQKREFNLLNISGLLLIFSGLATTYMHSTYVSLGMFFLIPWFMKYSPWLKFKIYYLITFFCMLILSLLITLFFGNLGVGNLWR